MITHRPILVLVLILTLFLPFAFSALVQAQTTDESAIRDLLDEMETAVLAQDQDAYLMLVDLSDPVFALEHTRWSDEWVNEDLISDFALDIRDLEIDADAATGQLTMMWALVDQPDEQRLARFPVQFTRDGSEWRYAGEQWLDYETEHVLIRAAPGTEAAAKALIPVLPDVYDHVTTSLDAEPSVRSQIKLYATSEALVAATLLSLPLITGWNEPGEALKLWPDGGVAPGVVAHEFTHFLEFDMAGTAQSRMPWWLSEGLAQSMASAYWSEGEIADYLAYSQQIEANRTWVDWDRISDFETTPGELWAYVYPQGYAFVRYITETFGEDLRNDWIKAMSVEMNIDEASVSVLGQSFDDLDADFRDWLAAMTG